MIKEYEIIKDNNIVKLNVVRNIKESNENLSLESIADILNKYYNYNKLNNEVAFLAVFDGEAKLSGIIKISIGTPKNCFFHKYSIITSLVLLGAVSFAYFHNHVAGNSIKPSQEDIKIYNTAKLISHFLQVLFVDSVIVNENDICFVGDYL